MEVSNLALFRAKAEESGEWVEGFYVMYSTSHYILTVPHNEKVRIDPKTLCRYTGLEDKNGKKVWEKDIFYFGEVQKYALVGYGKFTDDFSLDNDMYLGFWVFCEGEYGSIFNGAKEGYPIHELCEVVGNAYDNPELLEETEK